MKIRNEENPRTKEIGNRFSDRRYRAGDIGSAISTIIKPIKADAKITRT